MASCDSCVYNVYDEDDEEYYCEVDNNELLRKVVSG